MYRTITELVQNCHSLFKPHPTTFVFILSLLFTFHPSSLCFILHPCTKYHPSSFVLHPSSLYKDDNYLKVHLVTQIIISRDTSPDYHSATPQTFPPSTGSSCDPASISKRSSINCAPIVLHSCRNLSNSHLGSL